MTEAVRFSGALAVIVACGARTPIGLHAATSAAAVRAGIVGSREHPFLVDAANEPVRCALDRLLDPRLMGPGRMLALLEPALREAIAPLADAGHRFGAVPLLLALPEIRPGFDADDVAQIARGVAGLADLPAAVSAVEVMPQGHAAGLAAVQRALQRLASRACDLCIVVGVDSYMRPDTIEWLESRGRLANTATRSGFVPGEGAGCFLLANEHAARRFGLVARTDVRAACVAQEPRPIATATVCVAEGLTTAVRAAGANLSLPDEAFDETFGDINGERYRTEEWGFVCLKAPEYFRDPGGYRCPAESWGDMGAASGPLFVALACQAAVRGYARGPRTLLWAGSESGLRAVVALEARSHLAGRSGHV